jgi:hypothetical protein
MSQNPFWIGLQVFHTRLCLCRLLQLVFPYLTRFGSWALDAPVFWSHGLLSIIYHGYTSRRPNKVYPCHHPSGSLPYTLLSLSLSPNMRYPSWRTHHNATVDGTTCMLPSRRQRTWHRSEQTRPNYTKGNGPSPKLGFREQSRDMDRSGDTDHLAFYSIMSMSPYSP